MRSCNCVGYLTNPGGVCCMDLPRSPVVTSPTTLPVGRTWREPLTEEQVRQIIREELARAKRAAA